MHAVLVSVDYSDILAITLPWNRHHYDRVTVVTSSEDALNVEPIAKANHAEMLVTDLFYSRGAVFNKWAALEWALDQVGRDGWLCLMDADVCWPSVIPGFTREIGNLYSPLRRMYTNFPYPFVIPLENTWKDYTVHRNTAEWAGYSQIFHAKDEHLGDPPWHQIDWKHAGGADSIFQRKWPRQNKIRPPFDVLHIGTAGSNWYGRASPYLDGNVHKKSAERTEMVMEIWNKRRAAYKEGLDGEDIWRREKL
jgi:hypothetical protein